MTRKMKEISRGLVCLLSVVLLFPGTGNQLSAQEGPRIHVTVNLVQLNVAVTDKNGNYVTGLKPDDFAISEDDLTEKLASFAEGNGPTKTLVDIAQGPEHKSPPPDEV